MDLKKRGIRIKEMFGQENRMRVGRTGRKMGEDKCKLKPKNNERKDGSC